MKHNVLIRSTWMEHSGGTKFYRPCLVTVGKKSVLIANYGSLKVRGSRCPTRDSRPVEFGQIKVFDYLATSHNDYEGLMIEKGKPHGKDRGHYMRMGPELQTTAEHADAHELVVEHFGAAAAHHIMQHLNLDDDAEEVPSTRPDTKGSEPTAPRPEAWGTW